MLLVLMVGSYPLYAGPFNIAPEAKVTASSYREGGEPSNVVDGKSRVLNRFEWVSDAEMPYWQQMKFPWIRLDWEEERYVDKVILYDRPDLDAYLRGVGRCVCAEDFMDAPWIEKETLDTKERYNDLVVTALRTCEGIDIAALRHKFGSRLAEYCLQNAAPYLQSGKLEVNHSFGASPEGRLRLTRDGLFLSDGIMSDLLCVEG